MATRNVVLTEHRFAFITNLVSSGRYQNASDVMREGIRLVERQEAENEARLEAMRNASHAGIADIAEGSSREFDGRETLRDHWGCDGRPAREMAIASRRWLREAPSMADTPCRRRPPVP
jgi:antitoxin ParD1/3/4